jgi:predicted RNA-binding protein YlqC (UPF0109 family)
VKGLLEDFARALVDEPARVYVSERTEDGVVFLDLEVAEPDRGKVIGKRGRTAKAIRTVVKAAATREGTSATVEIVD